MKQAWLLCGLLLACESASDVDDASGGGGGTLAAQTGGGGGADAEGGGAGGGGCRALAAWTEVVSAGYGDDYAADGWHTNWLEAGAASVESAAGNGDYFGYEVWLDTTAPSLPLTGAVGGAYATCTHCALVYEDCTTTDCARYYLGQSGQATLTAFTAGDAGSVAVTLRDVTFVEWDFEQDVAVPGGGCLTLAAQTLAGAW